MDSKITINIVEPGSPTPDPVVPNTGLFTHGIGGPEATIIAVSAILVLALVAFVVWYYKKRTNIHVANITKHIKTKKRVAVGLTALAILVSAGTFAGLLVNAGKSNTNAAEGEDGLTLDVSSEDLTIEVGDEPVFAVLPVELTVEEATEAGYTLTAYTDNTDLVSTTDSSKVIPMVALEGDELAALTDNTYGLALTEPEGKDSEVYTALSTDADSPTFITDKDHKATEAGDTTTIYYGFYITPDVPYGTYTGSDIYYDVEENYITDLSFDGNGNDGGTAMEGMTIVAGDTITLPENTYTRAGYNFTGWNTAKDGTGKAYADEAEFTASLTESEDITLYAQWEALPVISDLTEMQDFAKLSTAGKASALASMTPGQQYQLKDNRDQTMYYIAKLADGHVWMTQNLDLDLSTETTLTSANTNISSSWTPENSTIATGNLSSTTWPSNSAANNDPYSYDPGDVFYYSSGNTNDDTPYTSLADCQAKHPDCSMKNHAGNYYSWSAAVASNDTSEYGDNDQYVNVDTSICPAGWKLPIGPNIINHHYNDIANLVHSYGTILESELSSGCGGSCWVYNYLNEGFNKIRTAPLWLARSGNVYYSSLSATGVSGNYWSSTVDSSSRAFKLYFGSSYVGPGFSASRNDGYSVRCIAQ